MSLKSVLQLEEYYLILSSANIAKDIEVILCDGDENIS